MVCPHAEERVIFYAILVGVFIGWSVSDAIMLNSLNESFDPDKRDHVIGKYLQQVDFIRDYYR